MKNKAQTGTVRSRIGNFIIFLLGIALVASATAKFAHVPKVAEEMGLMGLTGPRLTFVAVLELLSALLFLASSTRSLGLLLVSAFLGGAIATHLEHGQAILQPSIFLALLWLGAWLRHPNLLWGLLDKDRQRVSLAGETSAARI